MFTAPFLRLGALAALLAISVPAAWTRPVQAPAPYPRTVVDARGVDVVIPKRPQRIISITPGTTEMLFAIGAGNRVVGDTTYCDYPPAAVKIAKVGDSTTNYERIVALRPDLVVVDDVAESSAPAELMRLHEPFLVIHPNSFDSVEQSLVLLGRACDGEAQAAQTVATMERKRAMARKIASAYVSHTPRVLVVVGVDPLWVAGKGTFFDDLLHLAGAINAADALRGYAPESKELVLAHPPDIILTDKDGRDGLLRDQTLSLLPAVRAGRFGDTSGDSLSHPGPRLADGLLLIATDLRAMWATQGSK